MATNNATNYSPVQHNVQVGSANGALTSIAPSATSGVPLISQGASSNPTFGTAVVAGGGTGAVTFTAHGVLLGEGTGAVVATAAGTTGQVLTGVTGSDPTWQSPAASGALNLIQTQTASTSSSIVFTTGIATFTTYFLVVSAVITSANSQLLLQFSTDGGSTYLTTGYLSGINEFLYNSATLGNVPRTDSILLIYNTPTSGSGGANSTTWLYNLANAANPFATLNYSVYNGTSIQNGWGGGYNTTTGSVNALKISMLSGTITSGKFSLYSLTQ